MVNLNLQKILFLGILVFSVQGYSQPSFECFQDPQKTYKNQFLGHGVWRDGGLCPDPADDRTDKCGPGEIEGLMTSAGRSGTNVNLESLPFLGSLKTYLAGTLYAQEVQILSFKVGSIYAQLILGGPLGSSRIQNNGIWYMTTCSWKRN